MRRCFLLPLLAACAAAPPVVPPAPGNEPATLVREKPSSRPVPPGSGIGTAHAALVEAVARDGSWLVLCQARSSNKVFVGHHGELPDDTRPYLITGEGPGTPIDEYVSDDGVHLMYSVNGALRLFGPDGDMRLGARTPLPGDDNPLGPHPAGAVSAGRVLWAGEGRLTVRDLATGAERAVDPGPGRLVAATLVGSSALLAVVPRDDDGDGRLSPALPDTTLAARGCRGGAMSYGVYGRGKGDAVKRRLVDLDSGARVDDEAAEAVLSAGFLVRGADRHLELLTPGGARTPWLSCPARVLAVRGARSLALVACDEELHLLGPGGARLLGELAPEQECPPRFLGDDFVSFVDERGQRAIVELSTGRRLEATGRRLVHGEDGYAQFPPGTAHLVVAGPELRRVQLHGELMRHSVPGPVPIVIAIGGRENARTFAIDPLSGKAARLRGFPLATRADGRVLVAPREPESGNELPRGPLAWVLPDSRTRYSGSTHASGPGGRSRGCCRSSACGNPGLASPVTLRPCAASSPPLRSSPS